MDDDFKDQLLRRIETYRSLRAGLQERLRDLHHELNSVDRRLEAAEELYRREFDEEPAGSEGAPGPRATRIRGTVPGQPSWRDAVIGVLRRQGRPMHVREIWEQLQQSGFQTATADPLRSIVAIAIRSSEQIHRTGPNTFALNGVEPVQQQPSLYEAPAEAAAEEGVET